MQAAANLYLFPQRKAWLEEKLQPALDEVLGNLHSPASVRVYQHFARQFFRWHGEHHAGAMMSSATVVAYKRWMEESEHSSATLNLAMNVVRGLTRKAVALELLTAATGMAILDIRRVRPRGIRQGVRLTQEQASRLLSVSSGPAGLLGLRNGALVAVLLGCGLRRREVTTLRLDQIQQVDGRWAITNLVRKGGKIGLVPMASWTKAAVDAWTAAAGLREGEGLLLRALTKHGTLRPRGLSDFTVGEIVADLGQHIGMKLAPHDLRRTFARLARKGGADLEQIQFSLGHRQITTTMRYIGENQDLENAPCDRLGITLSTIPRKSPARAARAAPPQARSAPERRA